MKRQKGTVYPQANNLARQVARSLRRQQLSQAKVKERIAWYAPPELSGSSARLNGLKSLWYGGRVEGRAQVLRSLGFAWAVQELYSCEYCLGSVRGFTCR